MPFTIITGDKFTSDGTGQQINVPSGCDFFEVENLTQAATTQNPGRGIKFRYYTDGSMAADSAIMESKANSANTMALSKITSGGFTYYQSYPQPGAAVTGSAITAASPAVVTMTNSYSEGDRVVLYSTTGMLQIAGMVFTISSVSGSGFTLAGLDASGFAAAATNVVARKLPNWMPVEPEYLYVTNISKATQAVVTVSIKHDYVVGQIVHFSVPSSYGMSEIDQVSAKIVAVTDYTMTLDLDTSGYTTFAFPASSSVPTVQEFATLSNAGQRTQQDYVTGEQTGYNFSSVPFHTGNFVPCMYLAAGTTSPAGSSGDVIQWKCFKFEN